MTEKRMLLTCPYCGQELIYAVNLDTAHPQVIICDSEEGGCDQAFAVKIKTEYTRLYFTLELAGVRTA